MRAELLAGRAIGINEANDPNVLVIIHDRVLECVEIEAFCPSPDAIVDSVGRWVLGNPVRILSLGSLRNILTAISFTVAEILDEDTETACILNSTEHKRSALVTAVEKNGRRVHRFHSSRVLLQNSVLDLRICDIDVSKANLLSLKGLVMLQSLPLFGQLNAFGALWTHESDGPGVVLVIDDSLDEVRMVE